MPPREPDPTAKTIQAALLTWLVPGAGHYWLGHRGLAAVFFAAITFPYLAGLAIGGIVNLVNPRTNPWLFLAELGVGGYTAPSYLVTRSVESGLQQKLGLARIPEPSTASPEYSAWTQARLPYVSYYPASDVAQIYLATAGLLNILAILDAITRAQTGGLPTFHRDLLAAGSPPGGGP